MDYYTGNIYKYLNENGAIESLKNSTLKFNKSSFTNDPFECSKELIVFGDTDKIVDDLMLKFNDHLSIKHKREKRAKLTAALNNHDFRIIFEAQRNQIGIASFSERYNNPLMWAYYANNHNGVCLGYNIENGVLDHMGNKIFCWRVNYIKKIEKIIFEPGISSEFFKEWITTKSYHWKREEEVRLLYMFFNCHGKYGFARHKRELLNKVVFGLNTTDEVIKNVVQIVKEKYNFQNITFSKMKIGSELFTLEEVPFNV